jgi:hypothetical protein
MAEKRGPKARRVCLSVGRFNDAKMFGARADYIDAPAGHSIEHGVFKYSACAKLLIQRYIPPPGANGHTRRVERPQAAQRPACLLSSQSKRERALRVTRSTAPEWVLAMAIPLMRVAGPVTRESMATPEAFPRVCRMRCAATSGTQASLVRDN